MCKQKTAYAKLQVSSKSIWKDNIAQQKHQEPPYMQPFSSKQKCGNCSHSSLLLAVKQLASEISPKIMAERVTIISHKLRQQIPESRVLTMNTLKQLAIYTASTIKLEHLWFQHCGSNTEENRHWFPIRKERVSQLSLDQTSGNVQWQDGIWVSSGTSCRSHAIIAVWPLEMPALAIWLPQMYHLWAPSGPILLCLAVL